MSQVHVKLKSNDLDHPLSAHDHFISKSFTLSLANDSKNGNRCEFSLFTSVLNKNVCHNNI